MSTLASPKRVSIAAPGHIRGEIEVPGDKSISHRAAMLNALASGAGRVQRYSPGGDCRSTLRCLAQLGVSVRTTPESSHNLTLEVEGRGLAGLSEPEEVLDAENSGTTTRLLLGILAGQRFFSSLTGDDSLRRRPMLRVVGPLRSAGATIFGRLNGDRLPLAIRGEHLRGCDHRLTVASAQVKSALLLAGLCAEGPTTVYEIARTRDHTERMLRAQGVRVDQDGLAVTLWPPERLEPLNLTIPGDLSSAAYWIALACLHRDARVTVRGVGLNPTRTGWIEVLREMGARITIGDERTEGGEPVADLTAESSELRAVEVGGDLIPRMIDEVPLLAVAALFARGTTRIRDASELRVKESDRIGSTARELSRLGGDVRELPDGLEISGGRRLRSSEVESHGDHRLAMSLAVAGLAGQGASIGGAGSASVSYPAFWDDARKIGAVVRE